MAALRRTLRSHAWIALVAFLCGWMLPFAEAHPLGADDAACQSVALGRGPATPQVVSATTDQDQPTHCAICHLMRAMNGAVPVNIATLSVPFTTIPQAALLNDVALTVASAAPSSRGPPAAL